MDKDITVGWFYNDAYHCTDCAYKAGMDSTRSEDEAGARSQQVFASEIEGNGTTCHTCDCKMSELCEE